MIMYNTIMGGSITINNHTTQRFIKKEANHCILLTGITVELPSVGLYTVY